MNTPFYWIYVVGGIVSFSMSFFIGANDVANAFGPSFGSGALSLLQIVFFAGICEFAGAVLLGSEVTDTVRKKIVDTTVFEGRADILMLGMLCSLVGATFWVFLATRVGLPVSTTHSIVGAIIGFALAAGGAHAVAWGKVGEVVASWFISPFLSGLLAAGMFALLRTFVLRSPNSLERGYLVLPSVVFVTLVANVFFIIYKAPKGKEAAGDLGLGGAVGIAVGVGLVMALLAQFVALPWIKRRTASRLAADSKGSVSDEVEAGKGTAAAKLSARRSSRRRRNRSGRNSGRGGRRGSYPSVSDEPIGVVEIPEPVPDQDAQPPKKKSHMPGFKNFRHGDSSDQVLNDIKKSSMRTQRLHEVTENFDPATEALFASLQVITACFNAVSHGSNDVANATGAFAAIHDVYTTGSAHSKAIVPIWISVMGGGGLVLGLALYGHRVIATLGAKVIKITPSRGFVIELAAAITVLVASQIGIPISTTHSMVGAALGIGLLDGNRRQALNWPLVFKIFGAWLFTVIVSGLVSAAFFAWSAYSPSKLVNTSPLLIQPTIPYNCTLE